MHTLCILDIIVDDGVLRPNLKRWRLWIVVVVIVVVVVVSHIKRIGCQSDKITS